MSTDLDRRKHDDLTRQVTGLFFHVYNELGAGFLESVYQAALRLTLIQGGLFVEEQVPIAASFRGIVVGNFRADMVINRVLLLELKAGDSLAKEHESQTLNYLRATTLKVALLMNFGPAPRFERFVMDNENKAGRSQSVPIGVNRR